MTTRKDVKSQILTAFALASTSLTAGGSGDATAVTGATIDLTALTRRASSVSFEIPCRAVLAAGKKLTVQAKIQYSSDGTNWNDLAAYATVLTLLDSGSGSTMTGVARIGCDLLQDGYNYVRVLATPDLDASSTDTAVMGAGTAVFYSAEQIP